MSFCFSKTNGKLVYNDLGGYETRNSSTFWCIQKADEKYNWNDFDEIKVFTRDFENDPNDYTYSKKNNFNRLIPDFNFCAWPQVGIDDYEQFVKKIDEAGREAYEVDKVGWIGETRTNSIRGKLYNLGKENEDLFDIIGMVWVEGTKNENSLMLNSSRYISTPDLVKKYSILIDIEGNGYSGRLKHLLWSHRPLLLVDRPHKEFFFEFMKEWEHYIPVKRDLSDLVEKAKWCKNNYSEALKIAENAYDFSKMHLTRDECYKRWNEIVTENYKKQ